jgi:hypothetical protein
MPIYQGDAYIRQVAKIEQSPGNRRLRNSGRRIRVCRRAARSSPSVGLGTNRALAAVIGIVTGVGGLTQGNLLLAVLNLDRDLRCPKAARCVPVACPKPTRRLPHPPMMDGGSEDFVYDTIRRLVE